MTDLNPLAVQNAALLKEMARSGDARAGTVTILAFRVGRDESNVRKTLKTLAAEGLITASDRTLTDAGADQLAAILRAESPPVDPTGPQAGSDRVVSDRAMAGSDRVASIGGHSPQVVSDRAANIGGQSPQAVSDRVANIGGQNATFITFDQLEPDPDNARRDWDSDEAQADLQALADNIAEHGLLQNLIVVATDRVTDTGLPVWQLRGGERRWRAIGQLIGRGEGDGTAWPLDRPIAVHILTGDDFDQRLAALAENFQRRNLNPLEKARAFDDLATRLAERGTADRDINRAIADAIGTTIEHVQQHRAFLKLDDADQQRLTLGKDDPRRLTVRDARIKVANQSAREKAEADAFNPANLPAEQQLILVEWLHRTARISHITVEGPVDLSARDDAALQDLVNQNILDLTADHITWGEYVGHLGLSFRGWSLASAVRSTWPDIYADDGPDRAARSLAALREGQQALRPDAVLPDSDETPYLTAWLNPPYALSAEGQAFREERQARNAADAAEREARTAQQKQRLAAAAQARAAHAALLNGRLGEGDQWRSELDLRTRHAAEAMDWPLPWAVRADGEVIDADGKEIPTLSAGWDPSDIEILAMQMVVVAVNAAAGLPTPDILPDPDAEQEADACAPQEGEV